MGLFSRKEYRSSAASMSPMFDKDKAFTVRDDLILSSMVNREIVARNIEHILTDGRNVNYNLAYKKAKKDYTLGLPTVNLPIDQVYAPLDSTTDYYDLWEQLKANYPDKTFKTVSKDAEAIDLPIEVISIDHYVEPTPYKAYLDFLASDNVKKFDALTGEFTFSDVAMYIYPSTKVGYQLMDVQEDAGGKIRRAVENNGYSLIHPFRNTSWTVDLDSFNIIRDIPITSYWVETTSTGHGDGQMTTETNKSKHTHNALHVSFAVTGSKDYSNTYKEVGGAEIEYYYDWGRQFRETQTRSEKKTIYPFSHIMNPSSKDVYTVRYKITDPDESPYPDDPNREFLFVLSVRSNDRPMNGLYLLNNNDYSGDFQDIYPTVRLKDKNVGWIDKRKDTNEYKTAQKWLNKLNIKISKIVEDIQDSEGFEDSDDLRFISLYFGVNIFTDNEACKKYLYEFFEYLRWNSIYGQYNKDPEENITSDNSHFQSNFGRINLLFNTERRLNRFSYKQANYNVQYSWDYIESSVVDKVINKGYYEVEYTGNNLIIHKQTTDTKCIKLFVKGLSAGTQVPVEGQDVLASYDLAGTEEGTDTHNMYNTVPLMKGILDKLNTLEKETVVERSLSVGFMYGSYQRLSRFKSFLSRVAPIIQIAFLIISIAMPAMSAAAKAAGSITSSLIKKLVTDIIISFIKTKVAAIIIGKILKKLGLNIFSVIVSLIVSYQATGMTDGFKFSIDNALQAINKLSEIAETSLSIKNSDLMREYEEFRTSYTEAYDALQEAIGNTFEGIDNNKLLEILKYSPEYIFNIQYMDTTAAALYTGIDHLLLLPPYDEL